MTTSTHLYQTVCMLFMSLKIHSDSYIHIQLLGPPNQTTRKLAPVGTRPTLNQMAFIPFAYLQASVTRFDVNPGLHPDLPCPQLTTCLYSPWWCAVVWGCTIRRKAPGYIRDVHLPCYAPLLLAHNPPANVPWVLMLQTFSCWMGATFRPLPSLGQSTLDSAKGLHVGPNLMPVHCVTSMP